MSCVTLGSRVLLIYFDIESSSGSERRVVNNTVKSVYNNILQANSFITRSRLTIIEAFLDLSLYLKGKINYLIKLRPEHNHIGRFDSMIVFVNTKKF
jgi:hypothetical protein